MAALGRFWVCI